jgi:hypothetical protein
MDYGLDGRGSMLQSIQNGSGLIHLHIQCVLEASPANENCASFRISNERCNGRYQTAKERTQNFEFSDMGRYKPSTSFSLFLNPLKCTDVISARPKFYFAYA